MMSAKHLSPQAHRGGRRIRPPAAVPHELGATHPSAMLNKQWACEWWARVVGILGKALLRGASLRAVLEASVLLPPAAPAAHDPHTQVGQLEVAARGKGREGVRLCRKRNEGWGLGLG